MKNLGAALGWKHDHASGIETSDGKITKWPSDIGPEPNLSAQTAIITQFEARDIQEENYSEHFKSNKMFKALRDVCAGRFGMTNNQMKAAIKEQL